jgi:hypothetical protein
MEGKGVGGGVFGDVTNSKLIQFKITKKKVYQTTLYTYYIP